MNTSSNAEPEIIRREPFLVMGILTRITPGTESGEKFAAIWKDFETRRERTQAHSTDQRYYGVSFPTADAGRFDYLAGMAITPVQTIPEGLVVREVPAATYAVFACPVQAIGQTYGYIFGEWRSKSSHEIDGSVPAFEQYPPAEDTQAPVLIHIPIRDKQMN
jgi:AraC family transcriptional regulator